MKRKLRVDREDIINAYRLFLGRNPENEKVIQEKFDRYYDLIELCRVFFTSKEFNSKECQHRLTSKATDEMSVINTFTLLLGRIPENDTEIYEKMKKYLNIYDLLNGMMKSAEVWNERNNSNKSNIQYITSDVTFNKMSKIIYLHIPKTAGSSFHQLSRKNLKGRASDSMPSNINYIKWIYSKMIGGHFLYSQYDDMTADRLFLSVVRSPVDRALSLFNYYKYLKDGFEERRIELGFNPTSLKMTIEKSKMKSEFVDNHQCLYLSGKRCFSAFQKVLKNDKFIVGSFDNIRDWIRYLGEKLGWESLSFPKINVAQNSTYMDDLKSDKKLVNMIRDGNKEDVKLYDFITNAGVFTNCGSNFNFDKFKL